jgi:D-glycero-alpha-D-manno-heptose-7-phosphate kinase
MNDHWQIKRQRSPEMTNERIDHFYDVAMANGAMGGKLVGAGGGGFLLFYARDYGQLHAAMTAEGLMEVPFSFDHVGTTLIEGV